ncbi:MAG TPA: MBL fold metallo-hydrolase [Flavisolibacter sp.]|jgi:phosphoribosyl 1,2-cyclic phosphodiesterase|nr:MBL fold metallo-hydrolase [Flavisolibacter sp.]
MSLFIASLNSGSNGNCYYVGNTEEAILVDAGISCKEIELRMKRLGLDPARLKAIFISHEHADHIRGVPAFSKKYQIPVYITPDTLRFGGLRLEKQLIRSFYAHSATTIGGLSVAAFTKFHDAADPYSFTVSYKGITVGVFTDLGIPCESFIRHFQQCHAAFLEANYDEEMLNKGGYPYYLKQRIRGGKGHLSNRQALEVFTKHRPEFMSHVFLAHLSKNNNCPKLVETLFRAQAGTVQVAIASRDKESEVIHITGKPGATIPVPAPPVYVTPQLQFTFA